MPEIVQDYLWTCWQEGRGIAQTRAAVKRRFDRDLCRDTIQRAFAGFG